MQAASHGRAGPKGMPVVAPAMPTAANWIAVALTDAEGQALTDIPYRIHFADDVTRVGTLDGEGHARHQQVGHEATRVEYDLPEPPWPDHHTLYIALQGNGGAAA